MVSVLMTEFMHSFQNFFVSRFCSTPSPHKYSFAHINSGNPAHDHRMYIHFLVQSDERRKFNRVIQSFSHTCVNFTGGAYDLCSILSFMKILLI